MASKGAFPRAYVTDVPAEASDPQMEYVNFDNLGIGARKSGVGGANPSGIKGLDHVGGSAGSKGKGVNHA